MLRRSQLMLAGKHGLCSQFCATLFATSCHDGTASTGAHTGTETVHTCTTTVVWLVCAFTLCHGRSPSLNGTTVPSWHVRYKFENQHVPRMAFGKAQGRGVPRVLKHTVRDCEKTQPDYVTASRNNKSTRRLCLAKTYRPAPDRQGAPEITSL